VLPRKIPRAFGFSGFAGAVSDADGRTNISDSRRSVPRRQEGRARSGSQAHGRSFWWCLVLDSRSLGGPSSLHDHNPVNALAGLGARLAWRVPARAAVRGDTLGGITAGGPNTLSDASGVFLLGESAARLIVSQLHGIPFLGVFENCRQKLPSEGGFRLDGAE
jgi:hypothetical protein